MPSVSRGGTLTSSSLPQECCSEKREERKLCLSNTEEERGEERRGRERAAKERGRSCVLTQSE
eukprot:3171367-Rhodomonas_salina.1